MKQMYGSDCKLLPMRPLWNTAPGGRKRRAKWSAKRRCGEQCGAWAGRIKKSIIASERDEAARAACSEEIVLEEVQQLVFVDESSTHTSLTRLYGWAPHDQRAYGQVPRNHGKNTTLVAALTPSGLQAAWTIEGA